MINGLDLFSGIGGISYALREWVRPVAYCEIDPYCRAVMLSRMDNGQLYRAPIWDDVRTLNQESGRIPGAIVDIVYGGFPCQDISIAGLGKGLAGERSGLFYEIVRLAEEIKPTFIFLENVPAITGRGGLEVVKSIASLGYDCRWCVISAASVGALHRRERWFLLARRGRSGAKSYTYAHGAQPTALQEGEGRAFLGSAPSGLCEALPHSLRSGLADRQANRPQQATRQPTERSAREAESVRVWQSLVSSMDRVTDGLPFRVDRVKALGNSVVPKQAREAFKVLMGIHGQDTQDTAQECAHLERPSTQLDAPEEAIEGAT